MSYTPFSTAEIRTRRTAIETRQAPENQQHDLPPPAGMHARGLVRSTSVHVHAANVGALITAYHPLTHPRITAGLVFWFLGLVLAFFGTGSTTMDPAQYQAYATLNEQLVQLASQRAALQDTHAQLVQQLEDVKMQGTWWLHAERRATVKALQADVDSVQTSIAAKYAQAEVLADAQRKTMGLWSGRGIQSVRTFFWQSLFDAITQLFWMRTGDRSGGGSLAHVLQLVVMAVVNFTTGMMLTVFLFTCRLPGYIASFTPSLLSGLVFFIIALWCALSTVAAILALLYLAGIAAALGATNLLLMAADSRSRLGPGGPNRALQGPRGLAAGAHGGQDLAQQGQHAQHAQHARQLRSFYSFDSGLSLRHAGSLARAESSSYEYHQP